MDAGRHKPVKTVCIVYSSASLRRLNSQQELQQV